MCVQSAWHMGMKIVPSLYLLPIHLSIPLSYLGNLSSLQTLDGAHYLHSFLHSCTHNHAYLPCLRLSSFQTLDLSPLSALIPLPMSFHPFLSIHPSPPCSLCLTLPVVSPRRLPSSLLSLPDIMSSHYLHSSRCSGPSIYPPSLPSPPLRLSPPDRVTYYLHRSLHPSILSLAAHSRSANIRHTFKRPT